jgi:hypothetical protein
MGLVEVNEAFAAQVLAVLPSPDFAESALDGVGCTPDFCGDVELHSFRILPLARPSDQLQ